MAKLTPKLIIERHKDFPDSTEQLIESYAFTEYKKAISDLLRYGRVVNVENTDTTIIVLSDNDYKDWKGLTASHWYMNNAIQMK